MSSTAEVDARAHRRRRVGAIVLMLAMATAGVAAIGDGAGAALPLCGGNQTIRMSPFTCRGERAIDGTTFSVVLDVSGGVVTVSYSLDAARTVDTPVRLRSHHGISSQPLVADAAGTIPAGATSATLSVTLRCGQIDVKAVFVANGDARGRVTAPYVTDSTDCTGAATTTTTIPTTVTTTIPTSTTSTGSTAPTTPTTASRTSLPAGSTTTIATDRAKALPVTGSRGALLVVSALLLALGTVLLTASRARSSAAE